MLKDFTFSISLLFQNEEQLDKEDEFERKFNFRYEEPDQEFVRLQNIFLCFLFSCFLFSRKGLFNHKPFDLRMIVQKRPMLCLTNKIIYNLKLRKMQLLSFIFIEWLIFGIDTKRER